MVGEMLLACCGDVIRSDHEAERSWVGLAWHGMAWYSVFA